MAELNKKVGTQPGDVQDPRLLSWLVLVPILTATFLQFADINSVNVAIPSIQSSLNASFAQSELVISGYQGAFAMALLVSARVGRKYGERRMFLLGMTGFVVASAVCALSSSGWILVVGRVALGVFSGVMFPQVLSLIQGGFGVRGRRVAFGLYGVTIAVGTMAGPLIGGIALRWNIAHLSWRAIFDLNLPLGVIALAVSFLTVPKRPRNEMSLDAIGAVLSALGIGAIVFGLVEGRSLRWPIWIEALIGMGLVLLVVFWLTQSALARSRAKEPLVETEIFAQRGFSLGSLLTLLFFAGVIPLLYLLAIFLQVGLGYSPYRSAIAIVPFSVSGAICAVAMTLWSGRLQRFGVVIGALALAISLFVISSAISQGGLGLSPGKIALGMVIGGGGFGLVLAPLAAMTLRSVPPTLTHSASGVLSTAQQLGGALGIGIVGLLFFGSLGSFAGGAAGRLDAQIATQLRPLGAPALLIGIAQHQFGLCIGDRVRESDPTILPKSCLVLAGAIEQAPASKTVKQHLLSELLHDASAASGYDLESASTGVLRLGGWYYGFVSVLALLLVLRDPRDHPRTLSADGKLHPSDKVSS